MIDTSDQLAIVSKLYQLKPDATPLFGLMTAQHMVEHLAMAVGHSNGKMPQKLYTPTDKLPAMRKFLLSDKEFPVGVLSPITGANLLPLTKPDLAAAIEELNHELEKFHQYFQEHPTATPVNAVFGPLTYDEWLIAHNKHFTHHFKQFALL